MKISIGKKKNPSQVHLSVAMHNSWELAKFPTVLIFWFKIQSINLFVSPKSESSVSTIKSKQWYHKGDHNKYLLSLTNAWNSLLSNGGLIGIQLGQKRI